MNSKGNRVILLLVLILAAFSSAVKELNQLRQLGLEVNEYVALWSEKIRPAEVPPVPVTAPVVAQVSTCQSKHSEPPADFSWLQKVAQQDGAADVEERATAPVVKRTRNSRVETAKVVRVPRIEVDSEQFAVRMLNERTGEQDVPAVYEFSMPATSFKFRTRKTNSFKINPRDRALLKTLNRGINLRIAS